MKKNYMKTLGLCLAACLLGMGMGTSCTQTESPGAAVIFPQEKQPGKAVLTEQNGVFTLSNDLLTAKFINQDGKLTFAGAPSAGACVGRSASTSEEPCISTSKGMPFTSTLALLPTMLSMVTSYCAPFTLYLYCFMIS